MSATTRSGWRAAHRRRLPRLPRRPRIRGRRPHLGPRTLAGLVCLAALLVGAFFWIRQSSLVAVQEVTVTGVSGPDATAIHATLVRTAEGMSTLDLDRRRLDAAVAGYAFVRSLTLDPHFPHGLTIAVSEQIPVAQLTADGTRTTVAADGRLLRSTRPPTPVPTIALAAIPAAARVSGETAREVGLLAAAPYRLLARIDTAGQATRGRGLTVTFRDGPAVYFGADTQLGAKWRAVLAVLASPGSAGASYIDVTDPARPAAGSGSDTSAGGAADGPGETTGTQ
jgi:cell division protein FtsQ